MGVERILVPSAGVAFPFLEYAQVCAPNAAGQSISANTVTTLTVDTEVADTGGYGSVGSNQITLAAGTYIFRAFMSVISNAAGYDSIFSLYNATDAAYVTRRKYSYLYATDAIELEGQFTIAGSKAFELRFTCAIATTSGLGVSPITIATAGVDQRTTIKLWKVA